MNNAVVTTQLNDATRDNDQLRRELDQIRSQVASATSEPAGSLMGSSPMPIMSSGKGMPAANANGIVLYSLYAPAIDGYVWKMLRPPAADGDYYLRCNVVSANANVYWSTFNSVVLSFCNTDVNSINTASVVILP